MSIQKYDWVSKDTVQSSMQKNVPLKDHIPIHIPTQDHIPI